jgi:hypothetical protein
MLKALLDPNAAPVRALPRDEHELMIAANNSYLLAFDNLSGLPACTFARAYDANRQAAFEAIIENDPVAVGVQRLVTECGSWAGTASDFLRAATSLGSADISRRTAGWPRRLGRPASSSADIPSPAGYRNSLQPRGRAGTRTIRISSGIENRAAIINAVSTVGTFGTIYEDGAEADHS